MKINPKYKQCYCPCHMLGPNHCDYKWDVFLKSEKRWIFKNCAWKHNDQKISYSGEI